MPGILKRSIGRTSAPAGTPSAAVAALVASLESNVDELHATVSHREFREYIRNYDRSCEEAWQPIRSVARNAGYR